METKEKHCARQKRWRDAHPEEHRAKVKAWRKAHPEREHARKIKYQYGLSQDEFSILLFSQRSVCAICRQPFTETPLVDHDHETGKVRGLLCNSCNLGLGVFKNNSARLRLAAKYLEKGGM